MFQFGKRSKERMDGVHPLLQYCAMRALEGADFDMTIPWMGGRRTEEEQKEIYNRGASKADGTIFKSNHQPKEDGYSHALDSEPVGYNKESTGKKYLAKARNHFAQRMFDEWAGLKKEGEPGTEKFDLHWGGLWGSSGWDKQHFELVEKK